MLFFNKKKKEVEKSVNNSSTNNQYTPPKDANLEPPKEVPELAMNEFPIEDANVVEAIKLAETRKPVSDAPTLDMTRFQTKEEKPVQQQIKPEPQKIELPKLPEPAVIAPQPIIQQPRPTILPDPIIVQPQQPQPQPIQTTNKTTKTIITKDAFEDEEIDENPRIKHAVPVPLKYQNRNDDDESEAKNVRRETFFSKLKQQLENRHNEKVTLEPNQIIDNMRYFHQETIAKEKAMNEKQKMDSALAEKIMELELLEEGWYYLRKEIETKQILLIQKEKLLDEKVSELKVLMDQEKKIEIKLLSPEKWFVLKDGRKISSINDLKTQLKTIEDHIFYHHVNEERNDFSSWIRHVFEDASLADKIVTAKTKQELIRILEKVN